MLPRSVRFMPRIGQARESMRWRALLFSAVELLNSGLPLQAGRRVPAIVPSSHINERRVDTK